MRVRNVVVPLSLLVVAVFVVLMILPSKAQHLLPNTATDVHRQSHSVGGGDIFKVIMKARISPKDFEEYRVKMGFIPLPAQVQTELFWIGESWQEDWWDPTRDTGATYYDPEFGHHYEEGKWLHLVDYIIMKYENGYIYYYHKDL